MNPGISTLARPHRTGATCGLSARRSSRHLYRQQPNRSLQPTTLRVAAELKR